MQFAKVDCAAYPVRTQCTQTKIQPWLVVRDQVHSEVLEATRQRQKNEIFMTQYSARAGIEGTITQGARTGELRHSHDSGLPRTPFIRVAAWLAKTRHACIRRVRFCPSCPRGRLTRAR
jgi:hypothetical protein